MANESRDRKALSDGVLLDMLYEDRAEVEDEIQKLNYKLSELKQELILTEIAIHDILTDVENGEESD